MKDFKGTPGRWIKHGDSIEASGNIEVAVVVNFQEEEMMNADASLIAAAPDLLEALQNATRVLEAGKNVNFADWIEAIQKSKASISKALGEE